MNKLTLKAGVVGVGHLGKHHARIYSQIPDVELTAIADLNLKSIQSLADQFKCLATDDYSKLFDKIDLVSIAVPTTNHFKIAKEFLEHGIHVLVEKPITSSADDGRHLIEIASKNNRCLMVGQSERFNPAVTAATGFIKDPRFIEVHRLGPFSTRATDVDVVLDLMIHDIDLILSWVRSDISEIKATGVPVLTSRIDIANARIEFQNGCTANVTASRISMNATRKVRVFQPDSYISIDCLKQEIQGYRHKAGIEIHDNPMLAIETIPFDIVRVEPLTAELSSFVNSIATHHLPPVTGEAGLKALEVCQAITEIIRSNQI